ncbi:hypothetical protein ACFLSZ_05345 [Candidatus Bipolaricaulota bacterium]
MRKVLAGATVLILVSLAAFSGSFSALWDTDVSFAFLPAGSSGHSQIETFLLTSYEHDAWTIAATATFSEYSLSNFSTFGFYADGTLGAFTVGGLTTFNQFDGVGVAGVPLVNGYVSAQMDGFAQTDAVIALSLAGVQLFSFFSLQESLPLPTEPMMLATSRNGLSGSVMLAGSLVGAYGRVGSCWIGAEFDMGLEFYWGSPLKQVFPGLAGTDTQMFAGLAHSVAELWSVNEFYQGALIAPSQTSSCVLAFQEASFYMLAPFACFDLYSWIEFDCTVGFSSANLMIFDVDLGFSLVNLEYLMIAFRPESKSINLDFDIALFDTTCIVPYMSVNQNPSAQYQIDSISLDALLLECTMNGVTLVVSEIFNLYDQLNDPMFLNPTGFVLTETGRPCRLSPTMMPQCGGLAPWRGADEAIGIEINGDSCCGATFLAGIYTFFDANEPSDISASSASSTPRGIANPTGMFGWVGATAELTYGFSKDFNWSFGLRVSPSGFNSFWTGFEFRWGSPPDYGRASLRSVSVTF